MQVETRWHRPGARLDYTFDWTDQLVDGDTIVSKAVSIVTASAMTVDAGTIIAVGGVAAMGVVAWATGGVLGDTARVLCMVTTTAGRVDTLALDLTVGYQF